MALLLIQYLFFRQIRKMRQSLRGKKIGLYLVVADPLCGPDAPDFSASPIPGKEVGVDGEDPKIVSSSVAAVENGGGGDSDSLASNRNIRCNDFRFSNLAAAASGSVLSDSALRTLDGGCSCVGLRHWIGFLVLEYLSRLLLPDDLAMMASFVVVAMELSSLVFDVRGPSGSLAGIQDPFSPSSVDPALDPFPGLLPCMSALHLDPICAGSLIISPDPLEACAPMPRWTKFSRAVPAIRANLASRCIGDFLT